ncbi:DUF3182 family protein [Lysobacter sp. S4-A87]|uniref:DUF3182 family protein n=1 Tax=Lysobacter sp. S4-A87 TaxID=2925843 RepID=UPI001F52E519|nr:DUF3182 family protein [Lysobacter sp. S4-A87]UNK51038.1 DUF3182 family protein [Lysobacter sp. S4-A87]
MPMTGAFGREADHRGPVVDLVLMRKRGIHEKATRQWAAQRLAGVLGVDYGGEYSELTSDGPPYFVPDRTLLAGEAARFGIHGPDDLFGGVVPFPFVATKSITHPSPDDARDLPQGWSHALGAALAPFVLPGLTVFNLDDARRAGRSLLAAGSAIRTKPGQGIGGSGQRVVATHDELDAALDALDDDAIREAGLVLELNLATAVTYSVGVLTVGGIGLAYVGTQRTTRNHAGHEVYGGSTLRCMRGGLEDLLQATADEAGRRAVAATIGYDREVGRAFAQFFASRRNYDIVIGEDNEGTVRCGVLEQSWRIGGASPAEVLALQAMSVDPALERICVSSCEVYDLIDVPTGAGISFRGEDPVVGAITKYGIVEADDARACAATGGSTVQGSERHGHPA